MKYIFIVFIILSLSVYASSMFMGNPTNAEGVRNSGIEKISKKNVTVKWLVATFKIKDKDIAKKIYKSINNYQKSCPCPYNTKSNGYLCGGNSAYSRHNGKAPFCYPIDMIK